MVAFSGDKLSEALQADSLAKLIELDPAATPIQYSDPTDGTLEDILDGYAWTAIQQMAQARNIVFRKKGQTVRDLTQLYYDERTVKVALAKLSPLALGALAYLAQPQYHGLVNRDVLDSIFRPLQDTEKALAVGAELVGRGLAFFVQENVAGLVYEGYQKHDLNAPGFYGGSILIFVANSILEIAQANYQLENYLTLTPLTQYVGDAPKVPIEPSFEDFMADILTLSRYIEQNKTRVLQSGALGKRDYVKLNELLRVKEDLSKTSKLSETGRPNLVWNIAIELGLLIAKPDAIVQASDTAMQFYELARYQQLRLMLVAWANVNVNDFLRLPTLNFFTTSSNNSDIPTHSALVKARAFLLTLLENNLKKGQLRSEWVDFNSLLTLVRESNLEFLISRTRPIPTYYSYGYNGYGQSYSNNRKPSYNGFDSALKRGEKNKAGYYTPASLNMDTDWNLVEGEYLAQVFREGLAWLGAAALGTDARNRPVAFQLTELGRAALLNQPSLREQEEAHQAAQIAAAAPPELTRPLLVQPNFDLMVLAPFQNLALLRQIDRFADQTSQGDVAMYHLSKDTILRGFRNGLDGPQILQILNNNSRVPVAQNIQMSIQGWNTEFERVIMRPVSNLLEVPDSSLLDKVCNNPIYAAYIEKRLGPTFALLKGDVGQFDSLLQDLLPVDPNTNIKSIVKRKMTPLILDYNSLQPGSVKPTGANGLHIKPGYADPYLLYRLGQFADVGEWQPKNQNASFTLSAQAAQRGLAFGLNYEAVRRFLMNVVGVTGAVSPAMNLALKGWFGFYQNESVRGERAVTLQAAANLLNDIAAIPEFNGFLLARPTLTTILVRENNFVRLQERLQEWGLRVIAPELSNPQPSDAEVGELEAAQDNGHKIISFNGPDFDTNQPEPDVPFLSFDSETEPSPEFIDVLTALLNDDFKNENDELSSRRRSKNKGKLQMEAEVLGNPVFDEETLMDSGIKNLHADSRQARQAAVNLLSSLGVMAARQMVPLLYDPEPKVRYNACIVLAATGDAESLAHLKLVENDLSRTQSGSVGQAAQYAIRIIQNRLAL